MVYGGCQKKDRNKKGMQIDPRQYNTKLKKRLIKKGEGKFDEEENEQIEEAVVQRKAEEEKGEGGVGQVMCERRSN
jgi:hypothetical protein